MDEKPSPNQRSIIVDAIMAVVVCTAVGLWWCGIALDGMATPIAVMLNVCAVFQVAKVGWMIYWWRRSIR